MTKEQRISDLERRLLMAKAVLVLKASSGWPEYLKQLEAEKQFLVGKVLDPAQQNREYWAGVCRGLTIPLDLMKDVEEEVLRIESELARLSGGDVSKDPIGGIR